ncbi:MAG: S-layer homology domain-containing protein, partial [Clostridia bacterium]|nr:S-layer homology domain-containing protein [Clostridia bacterium]
TSITRSNDGNKIIFQAIADGQVTGAGIVYSTTTNGNNLKIGGSGVTNVAAEKLTNNSTSLPESIMDINNCYSLQITPESDETVYHARAYVTVGDETTYGDVKDVKNSELQCGISMIANLEGFDPESGLDEILSGLADGIKTVTYFANGGVGAPLTQAFKGDSLALRSNTFTREGYTFAGWSTEETGSVVYKDGETVETEENLVLYAQWKRKSSGSSGGGSSLVADNVTVEKADNGSVSVSPTNATKGNTVTITVTPDKGYKLGSLTVTDKDGKDIAVTEKDGKYTFTIPDGKVTVTPVFVKDDSEPTTPPTDPTTPPADNENPFIDVNEGDYFYDAVLWAAKEGVTSGTTPTTFSPNESCTRGQTVTFLWRAAGSPEPKTNVNPFTDVKTGDYFYKAVLWAYENGITKGTSDTEFSPEAIVTRGQTVTFLYRLTGDNANGKNPFTDVKTSDYFYDAVLWAAEENITSGTSDTTFSPDDDCLRGQIVTFLYRYYK